MIRMYHIELKTESPTIIVLKTIKNWYKCYTDYIPSRTMVGALITKLNIIEPGIGEKFIKKPFINVSDFYIDHCLPAPPLSLECKGDRDRGTFIPLDYYINKVEDLGVIYEKYLRDVYRRMLSEINTCKVNGIDVDARGIIRCVGGELITRCSTSEKCLFKRCRGKAIAIESVGVSGITHSTRTGLLYTYEAIPPETAFHGFLVVKLDHSIDDVIKSLENELILIGRGISRGYGRVRVTKVSTDYKGLNLDNSLASILQNIFSTNKEYMGYVSLSAYMSCGITRLIKDGVYKAENIVSTGIELYSGWSKLYGTFKPSIELHKHGTIAYHKFDSVDKYYEFILSKPGLNLIIPLDLYRELIRC